MLNISKMLPSLILRQVFIFVILWYSAYSQQWESGLRQRYDGYGEDWIFMPDGNGQPQVAVLKGQDSETRGVLDSEIAYIIYTRYLFANPNAYYLATHYYILLFTLVSNNVFKIKPERRRTNNSK